MIKLLSKFFFRQSNIFFLSLTLTTFSRFFLSFAFASAVIVAAVVAAAAEFEEQKKLAPPTTAEPANGEPRDRPPGVGSSREKSILSEGKPPYVTRQSRLRMHFFRDSGSI